MIILQIIANQCWFYAIWMNIHYIAANILGMNLNMSVSFFFTDYEFSLIDLHFYLIIVELALTCIVMVPLVVFIAERAKKCLDFCSTIFFIHFCVCFSYNGFPLNIYWWLTMGSCLLLMTLLSERVALKRELEEILVSDILDANTHSHIFDEEGNRKANCLLQKVHHQEEKPTRVSVEWSRGRAESYDVLSKGDSWRRLFLCWRHGGALCEWETTTTFRRLQEELDR